MQNVQKEKKARKTTLAKNDKYTVQLQKTQNGEGTTALKIYVNGRVLCSINCYSSSVFLHSHKIEREIVPSEKSVETTLYELAPSPRGGEPFFSTEAQLTRFVNLSEKEKCY